MQKKKKKSEVTNFSSFFLSISCHPSTWHLLCSAEAYFSYQDQLNDLLQVPFMKTLSWEAACYISHLHFCQGGALVCLF